MVHHNIAMPPPGRYYPWTRDDIVSLLIDDEILHWSPLTNDFEPVRIVSLPQRKNVHGGCGPAQVHSVIVRIPDGRLMVTYCEYFVPGTVKHTCTRRVAKARELATKHGLTEDQVFELAKEMSLA